MSGRIGAAPWAWPWHPFLLACYPALYLLSRNTDYAEVSVLFRPQVVALAGAGIVYGVLRAVYRDRHRASAAASLLIAAFFLYGLYSRAAWQMGLCLAGFAILFAYTLFGSVDWRRVTRGMNAFAVALVLVAVVAILRSLAAAGNASVPSPNPGVSSARPDIYYFILDGYGREDVLREYYGIDNGPFVRFLRDQGFIVNDEARSNYAWTIHSLASALNYEHASTMARELKLEGESLLPMIGLVRNNRIMAYLRGQGYAIHGYMPGYMRGNLVGADIVHRDWWAPTEFESALLNLTPIPPLMWKLSLPTAYEFHRRMQLYTLEAAERLFELPSPKFVFVHLLCPHPPFVFDANGEPRPQPSPRFTLKDGSAIVGPVLTREEYVEGYRGQLEFLNSRLTRVITSIRTNDPGAIVIVQGDHGPASMADWTSAERTNMRERFGILNAVYLPGPTEGLESSFVSPVNTFRVILNRYLGGRLELLPDTSYFTLEDAPYAFEEVDVSVAGTNASGD